MNTTNLSCTAWGVYEIDENKEAQLIETMKLACDNDDWAVVNGRLYKKEVTCPVAAHPTCIRRIAMSEQELTPKKRTRFYKILEEKEFNNFIELRAALERENGTDT